MKNLMILFAALLSLGACRKADDVILPAGKVPVSVLSGVQNLGHAFSGTNITWKLHPLDPNNAPLFTYLPGQSGGHCLLMIDNGALNGLTPVSAFKFVAVDVANNQSKTIEVKDQDGNPATYSLGRIVRYTFGMDKKFYVATEGAPDGGGHLVQYDPASQTAVDLGKPFKKGDRYLDIYSLNVGTDGALYGGSFGGSGDVMTFRYADNRFYVDATTLDNTSRYVTNISGDSRYTYAVCGKNNWFLYAIDRQTGETRLLKSIEGNAVTMDMGTYTDAPYAHSEVTHYRLNGFTISALPKYYTPTTQRVQYVPYTNTDTKVPQVSWNDVMKQVDFKLASGQTGSVKVSGLHEDIYPTGSITFTNNRLYIACAKQGLLGEYASGKGFQTIGRTSMNIAAMASSAANSNSGSLSLGGYPKGGLLQYSPNNDWSVNANAVDSKNGGFATTTSNPSMAALFQNADAAGINGPMNVLGMAYTNSGFLAAAGNNDRITESSGRELAIGSFKNGQVNNLYKPEFSNYSFRAFSLTTDGNYALIAATPHAGNTARIYKYDAASNTVINSWDLPLWGDMSLTFQALTGNLLICSCDDTVFLFDLTTGTIAWKEVLGQGQKIYALAIAPDHSVYINHMYLSTTNFKIKKYTFNLSGTAVEASSTDVAQLRDEDNNEQTKPTNMLITSAVTGNLSLYISGLSSLYKVNI